MDAKVLAVIPARWASTRFPGKPLARIGEQSMIQRVIAQVSQSKLVSEMVVATDDQRIFDHVADLGANVLMTSSGHPSGTDRCAEAARQFPNVAWVLNVQGDEPFIQPEQIDLLVSFMQANEQFNIATLAKQIEDGESLFNPNVVKVVFGVDGRALYFSRHPIPFVRGCEQGNWLQQAAFFKHIGLYGFRYNSLMEVAQLQPSSLEISESLEQLRWLQNGFSIGVATTAMETQGIDTPEDLAKLVF